MDEKRRPTENVTDPAVTGTERPGWKHETGRVEGESLIADGGIQLDEFIEALADKRRRYVLYHLRTERTAELDEITEHVAAWTTGTAPDALDEQRRKNTRVTLHHAHLPKLEEAGIIGYDRRQGSVCFHHPPDPVVQFLDYCASIESPPRDG